MSKIDTSTTAGKIRMMQAFEFDDNKIEARQHKYKGWNRSLNPNWDWVNFDYRIKPKTIEEVARDRMNINVWHGISVDEAYIKGAEFGAEWQKDQDNE